MTDIGRNFWFPQCCVLTEEEEEGKVIWGCDIRVSGKDRRTWIWLRDRSDSLGLSVCLSWKNGLIKYDTCISIWSL